MPDEPENPKPPPGEPIPRGRHDFEPEAVRFQQRERIVDAVAEIIANEGFAGLTVDRVVAAARVSRATFYLNYANKREALLGAHDRVFAEFVAAVALACSADQDWPGKVSSAIAATVDFALAQPDRARLLSTGLLAADAEVAARVTASYDRLAGLLRGIREQSVDTLELPECTETFLIGAVAGAIARALRDPVDAAATARQKVELIELVLIPYCGIEEAARIASR